MIEFNTAILTTWILSGCEALRVYNYKDFFIVEPIIENDFDDGCMIDYDIVKITDQQCFDMAEGAGLLKLNYYYFDDDYFEGQELLNGICLPDNSTDQRN